MAENISHLMKTTNINFKFQQILCVCAQLCPDLCDPMNCSLSYSSGGLFPLVPTVKPLQKFKGFQSPPNWRKLKSEHHKEV